MNCNAASDKTMNHIRQNRILAYNFKWHTASPRLIDTLYALMDCLISSFSALYRQIKKKTP